MTRDARIPRQPLNHLRMECPLMSTNDPLAASPREADSGDPPALAKYRPPRLKRLDLAETEGASTGGPDGAGQLFSQN